MSIKKFFIGMAILLSVSLFVIGCPTEVEEKTNTVTNTYGKAEEVASLQALLDDSDVSKVTYSGTGALAIDTEQLIVPKRKTLVAAKGVTLSTGKFIVAGTLELGDEGEIAVTGTTGLVIGDATTVLGKITGDTPVKGSVAATVAAATTALATDTAALVENASDTDLVANSVPSGKKLYVSGELSLAAAPAATGAVIALGTVNVSADVDLSSIVVAPASIADGKLDISGATLTNSAKVTVTLPSSAVGVKAIEVGNTDLTIAGATSLTVTTLTGGTGKLTAPGITVSGKTDLGGAAAFSGDAAFGGDVSGITFNGPVAFGGDLTLTAVAATFKGNVSFAASKKIVMTTAASVITLGPGVLLGIPTIAPAPAVYGSVIANPGSTGNVTLTPAANTKLMFAASGRAVEQGAVSTNAHGITIGGNASLPAGATYTVASEDGKVGTLTIGKDSELLVADGVLGANAEADSDNSFTSTSAKLVLTGAATEKAALLKGAGSVKAGAVTIVGGTNGWEAVDTGTDTVTISVNTITSSADSAVLTGITGGATAPSITVAAAGTLTIAADTAINLASNGSIVLAKGTAEPAVTGGTLNLDATSAKISGLTGGTDDQTLTTSNIANATYTVGSATGNVTGGGSANAGNAYITGGNDTGPNPIVAGNTANATIDKDTLVGANT
jgi:hypothetical protein